MPDQDKPAIQHPAEGGSYIRQPDGSTVKAPPPKDEAPADDQAAKASPAASASSKK